MARHNFRELGMDTMERLYYERQDYRKKRYEAGKKKKPAVKNGVSAKRRQMEQDSMEFEEAVRETLSCGMENVC